MSTAEVCVSSVRATDLLLGHDPWGASWIAAHRARQAAEKEPPAPRERIGAQRPRTRGARRAEVAPDDGAIRRATALHARRQRGAGSRAARRSSTPPAGTGSRSTRPAAATAPARSARSRSSRARSRSARWTRARSPRPSCATAGDWHAARGAREDLVVRGAAAADAAEGGDGRRRPARDPAPVGAEAPPRARRADDGGPALGPAARARRARRPRAVRVDRAAAGAGRRRCAPRTSTSPPSSATAS